MHSDQDQSSGESLETKASSVEAGLLLVSRSTVQNAICYFWDLGGLPYQQEEHVPRLMTESEKQGG